MPDMLRWIGGVPCTGGAAHRGERRCQRYLKCFRFEAARRLQVSVVTVCRYLRTRQIAHVSIVSGLAWIIHERS